MKFKKFKLTRKRIVVFILIIIAAIVMHRLFLSSITVNPVIEKERMEELEETKETVSIGTFVSDGCSGNMSTLWNKAITGLLKQFPKTFSEFEDAQTLPFEEACVRHDREYHRGDGGYLGRLEADNTLRRDIISYGVLNIDETKQLTGVDTDEEAICMYEMIAEVFYRSVRLGGAPCTGKSYAWGYGYGEGVCE